MKHKPLYEETKDSRGIVTAVTYRKNELDDDFLFRKTASVSINEAYLERCTEVRINVVHRGVEIFATREEIIEFGDVRIYHGETKFYYPCSFWKVLSGDRDWVRKLP